ncbi:MAG: hypothetical protein LJE64_13365 [Desulfofustis sp.]|nr:hypothetical protein [Desulfofustis sp.]
MKTVLTVLCWIGIAVMLGGCDDGDDNGGTAGAYGDFPEVSFVINESTGNVICYNADKNVITTQQICTWNCAYYNNKGAVRKVTLWFDEALVCRDSGIETTTDPDTGEEVTKVTQECTNEIALVKEDFDPCVL